ncbi:MULTISPECIES: NAD(P)-dependent oxidoreductase [unclassified Fibrobacter]|uniref:NAD(P)-dependent oxidoreductase n=1 Tax=unclassified Fibrobacter TaxID=2634177 RepID=UPI000D6AB720|nr:MULTISPECIES: NAD(P)-dependent oxidoreductase [unclassified Fibrobacter]PWJ69967.1 precorrin-2 dehydrogenase/sirohydrochlorin ferrochelatase [Fibrobacter sp. UWR4]PZW73138.1 precorrin-2 dehydrogenase/sirohydrochlorin ferrochelatase [Fibrobacter sp. UWR1]
MKVVLIIAHNCIRPGAYRGFETVLDRLRHDMPDARIASTSLVDLDNDLRALLREDVESVTLLPYLLLNGQHSKGDIPAIVANAQKDFPQIPMTLLPPLGEWDGFADMVVKQVCKVNESPFSSKARSSDLKPQSVTKSSLFAIEVNLEGKNVLVVGGGRIALRKVKTLIPAGARITVVAPQFDPEFHILASELSDPDKIVNHQLAIVNLVERPYESLDLRGVSMVFICTDQPVVNAQVSNDARARRIMVNNACDYLDGDFIVPARMDFGENITVTVSTRGRAPSLAKKLKQKIQTDWAEDLVLLEKSFTSQVDDNQQPQSGNAASSPLKAP